MLNIIRLKAYKKFRELREAEKSAALELEELRREREPERQKSRARLAADIAPLKAILGTVVAAIGGILVICLKVLVSRSVRRLPNLPSVDPDSLLAIAIIAIFVVFGICVVWVIVNAKRIWAERDQ
jgi:hypothetical protein